MKTFTDDQINQLIHHFPLFPESTNESTVEYNTGKLIEIIRKKEVFNICNASENEWNLVNDIDISFGTVVRDLVMEKDLEKSLEEYYTILDRIEKETYGNLYLYAKQGALSVISLYHYKKKNWEKAVDYTVECICLNDYLIELGMTSLSLRVYEQNKNISRVLLRQGKTKEGFQLVNNLLNYLLTGANNGLYGSTLKHNDFWGKASIIRETYSYEMFCMIVEDMIRFNTKNPSDLFPQDWFNSIDFEVDNINRQVIYNYMYLLKLLRAENFTEFTESFIYYMNEPISVYYEILKLSLVIEIAKKSLRQKGAETEKLAHEIAHYVQNKLKNADSVNQFIFKYYLNSSNFVNIM